MCAHASDRIAHRLGFVAAKIVHDDDIASLERWQQNALNINQEHFSIDRPIQQKWCCDPIMAQRRQESLRSPAPVRHLVVEPDPALTPSSERRHICLGPGLINEYQPVWIDVRLTGPPLATAARDIRAVLFAGNQRLFLWL